METKEKFKFKSEVLKRAREDKGYSQEELAQAIFTTRQSISNWENGKKIPTLENVKRISEVLDITTDELIEINAEKEKFIKELCNENLETSNKLDNQFYFNYDSKYCPTIREKINFIKIISIIILIIFLIYISYSIRKFCILYDIYKKMNEYADIENYSLETEYFEIERNKIVNQYNSSFIKRGEKYKVTYKNKGEVTINYIFDNNWYILNDTNKTYEVYEDYKAYEKEDYERKIESELFSQSANNFINIIKSAFSLKVKIVKLNCYYIYYSTNINREDIEVEECISYETGLIESKVIINNNIRREYSFKFQEDTSTTDIELLNLNEYSLNK